MHRKSLTVGASNGGIVAGHPFPAEQMCVKLPVTPIQQEFPRAPASLAPRPRPRRLRRARRPAPRDPPPAQGMGPVLWQALVALRSVLLLTRRFRRSSALPARPHASPCHPFPPPQAPP